MGETGGKKGSRGNDEIIISENKKMLATNTIVRMSNDYGWNMMTSQIHYEEFDMCANDFII